MQTKTKITIGIAIVVITTAAAIVLNINNFSLIHEESKESDTKTAETTVKNEKKNPKLELTQEIVELEIGANFEFKDFIKTAEDSQGYNLKDKVQAPIDVPTDKAGEYKITYKLELSNGKSISKELILKIIDPITSDTPD